MKTEEHIGRLETQRAKLVQEISELQAKMENLQTEKEAHVFAAFVELSANAQKQVEGLNYQIANFTVQIADRKIALASLERKLTAFREVLRQEKFREAEKGYIEALVGGYMARIEIEGLTKQIDGKWAQSDQFRNVALNHRKALIELGGKQEDFYVPSDFREIKDGESTAALKKLEAKLNK